MDRLKLVEKGMEFMTRFASPSVLTGRFVTAMPSKYRDEIDNAFTDPGTILVHSMEELYADKEYSGYKRVREIRESDDEIIVILDKEEAHERDPGE